SDGAISGYRWGAARKLRLIELERALAAGSGAWRRCTATPASSWYPTFPGKTSPPERPGTDEHQPVHIQRPPVTSTRPAFPGWCDLSAPAPRPAPAAWAARSA